MEKQTFQEKVKSLTGKEILLAMIEGVKNPSVNLDFNTYGSFDASDGLCYGCAATNAVCKISGITFTKENINTSQERGLAISEYTDSLFLFNFEHAIDYLRQGWVDMYNNSARECGFATLPINRESENLPALLNGFYKKDLDAYVDYANSF